MNAQQRFEPARESVSAARRFVLGTLDDLPSELADRVTLIVSELATNAVLHARSAFELSVERTATRLRIEISDRGGGMPTVRPPQPATSAHGRGLRIVDTLADRWGIVADQPGKRVWVHVEIGERLHSVAP